MAEILLIFPSDKKTAAHQIEAALGSAGYGAVLEPVAEADGEAIARKASDRDFALLIWSRSLAASADLGGWLPSLRRLPNLIEVSTDGIAPQSGDERRVVLLSGWRGQPFHLGWQRILEELEGLGARRSEPRRPAPPPAAAPAAVAAAEGGAAPAGAVAGRRRLALPAAAALALLGAVAGAAWIGTNRSDPPPPAARSAPSAGEATTRTATEAAPQLAPYVAPEALEPAPVPPPGPAAAEPIPAGRTAERPVAERAPGRTAEAVRPPARHRTAAADLPVKRYSKKNSKTMRLFCARSGRSTPQCRTFLRSTRAARPESRR
ncbi:MAG TPA: hypothetical protein VF759_06150 [Allosphingosinicella sp.]